jgi:hypothetical protein
MLPLVAPVAALVGGVGFTGVAAGILLAASAIGLMTAVMSAWWSPKA